MKYLLDTDHISILQWQTGTEFVTLSTRMGLHSPSDFAVSIISFHEQVLGGHAYINRAKTSSDLAQGYRILAQVLMDYRSAAVVPFDAIAASAYDGFASLRSKVKSMDLRIAAIALANGLTVLTRNARDFSLVPRLIVQDWTV